MPPSAAASRRPESAASAAPQPPPTFARREPISRAELLGAPVGWPEPSALDAPLQSLAGAGPKLSEAAAEAGISTLGDLLLRVPHSYRDRSTLGKLADLGQVRKSELDEIDTDTSPSDDSGSIDEEQVDDAVAVQLRAELGAVERAEQRLEDGSYGLSVESGEPIPAERLEAIPWAERTPEEQQRFERTHGRLS